MRNTEIARGVLRSTIYAAILVGTAGQIALADGKWTSFELGSTETIPAAINDKGVVVGYYMGDGGAYSFLRTPDGIVTSFNVGQKQETQATAINISGAVTGSYDYFHGFLRAPDGTITTFDPAYSIGTYPMAINDKGTIAGYWYKLANGKFAGIRGFLRTPGGNLKTLNVPKALNTYASAINSGGVIAGSYDDANKQWHGFVRGRDGALTTFSIPKVQATNLAATGINTGGQVVGYYSDSNYNTFGFLRSPDGTIAILDYSNGYFLPYTMPHGINDSGQIAGGYVDGRAQHGFVRSPDGQVTTLDFPDNEDGTTALGLNRKGLVMGYYLLGGPCTAYTFCGFVWKP